MTKHSQIKQNLAKLIQESSAVRDFCVENFGRGALVIVDWYGAEGSPGERESPFVFLYSANENDAGFVDEETFNIHIVCAARFNAPTRAQDGGRTATANGLVVNGVGEKMEAFRAIVEDIVTAGGFGAVTKTITREESSTVDWPLEWAKLNVALFEPETI